MNIMPFHDPVSQSVAGLSPLRSEFDIGPHNVRFAVDKLALGEVLFLVIRLSPRQHHSSNATLSSSSICCSYQTDTRAKKREIYQNATLLRMSVVNRI
jgi:hypothetical protein